MNMNKSDLACVIVIILVVIGIVSAFGYSWYTDSQKKPKTKDETELIVKDGDLVTCEFTEYIWTVDSTGNLTYAVYQTTSQDIAEDPEVPKSVTFQFILANETEDPIVRERLVAIVGPDLVDEMNTGFKQLVLGMKEGESKKGEIPVTKGYGERNDSLIQKIPINDKTPLYETISRQEFEARYPQELPLEIGKSFKHHYWNWYIKISSLTTDEVLIKHEPELGAELDIFSWRVTVENISEENGLIWIKHRVTPELVNKPIDVETLAYYNPKFTKIQQTILQIQQPYPGIILSIKDGIEIDFNRENIGKNLRYEIRIIKIERD